MIYDCESFMVLIKTILYSFQKHDEAILRNLVWIIFSTKKIVVLNDLPLFKGSK